MIANRAIPRAEQVGSLKRSDRLIAANEAAYAPGHLAIEASERAHGLGALYAVAEEETRRVVQRQLDIELDLARARHDDQRRLLEFDFGALRQCSASRQDERGAEEQATAEPRPGTDDCHGHG